MHMVDMSRPEKTRYCGSDSVFSPRRLKNGTKNRCNILIWGGGKRTGGNGATEIMTIYLPRIIDLMAVPFVQHGTTLQINEEANGFLLANGFGPMGNTWPLLETM